MSDSNLLIAGVMLLLGVLLGCLTWISLQRERVWTKTGTHYRSEEPFMYWMGISVYGATALGCLVAAVAFATMTPF